jgi:hypothetical protein
MMAEAMGLPLDAANPAEVARNLSLAFRLAEQFMDVPLGDEAEFAAVFSAREQADG